MKKFSFSKKKKKKIALFLPQNFILYILYFLFKSVFDYKSDKGMVMYRAFIQFPHAAL